MTYGDQAENNSFGEYLSITILYVPNHQISWRCGNLRYGQYCINVC